MVRIEGKCPVGYPRDKKTKKTDKCARILQKVTCKTLHRKYILLNAINLSGIVSKESNEEHAHIYFFFRF